MYRNRLRASADSVKTMRQRAPKALFDTHIYRNFWGEPLSRLLSTPHPTPASAAPWHSRVFGARPISLHCFLLTS